MDVTINQIKVPGENNEVSKFAYGHRTEGLFQTKSRRRVGGCGTNDLYDRFQDKHSGVKIKLTS